jgi:peptidoglycan/xylan/chitin deacetylase (PgdA/CDA1 family)
MTKPRATLVPVVLVVLLVGVSQWPSGSRQVAAARPVRTIVSLEFDDGLGQPAARGILQRHHMHGAFYINTGYIGTGEGRFTWQQLRNLQADGNEIAGHTLTHRDLPTLSSDEQAREICIDRKQLIEHGLRAVDFAYPFGSYDRGTEKIVPTCGYQSGRAAWGLWGSGCESTPADCPYAVDPTGLQDRWAIPTADAPIDLTYLIDLQRDVTNAEQNGGGWVQIFWHRLCNDDCDEYSWAPTLLDQFLTWLEQRAGQGTIVETPQQVLGETWHGRTAELASIHIPPPPPPPAGDNRLRNPGLEAFDNSLGAPSCWELSGGAGWSRVAGVSGKAELGAISGAPDGYAAIAQPLDQGACAPAVHQGERLRFSAAYRTNGSARFVVWARNPQGGWAFWTDGPLLSPRSSFATRTWDLPPIPAGVSALSIGVALNGDGSLGVDDLSLTLPR